jgi:undecaprenyl diphosphate synthase
MDGNGRWAKTRGLPRNEGHRAGVRNAEKIVRAAGDLGIRYLTLYAFSAENWDRPREEVAILMKLLERFLKTQLQELVENSVRLKVIGRLNELSPKLQTLIAEAVDATADFDERTLILALNYGARHEVVDAVIAYANAALEAREKPAELTWDRFASYLYTDGIPDPDLIIRTSGEARLSNFLLMQGAYSEFYFTTRCWPDFDPAQLEHAIDSYRERERRFGKTGEQVRRAEPQPVPVASESLSR